MNKICENMTPKNSGILATLVTSFFNDPQDNNDGFWRKSLTFFWK